MVLVERLMRITADLVWNRRGMRVPHEAIKVVVTPLQNCDLELFVVKASELAE